MQMEWQATFIDYIDDRIFLMWIPSIQDTLKNMMKTHENLCFDLEDYPRKLKYLLGLAEIDWKLIQDDFDVEEKQKLLIDNLVHNYNQHAHFYNTQAMRQDLENDIREEIEYMRVCEDNWSTNFWTSEDSDDDIHTV